jgi:hypothetical protein
VVPRILLGLFFSIYVNGHNLSSMLDFGESVKDAAKAWTRMLSDS